MALSNEELIEALAFFSARTLVSSRRNILKTRLRLFQQYFPFLLDPLPSMGLLQFTPTGRQTEVLRLLAGGMTNREIASALDISVHTVDRHISQIYRRIGARGRADATGYAIRHALVD